MDPSGRDPNRIDVSLNLVSDQAGQAIATLTSQLSVLNEFISTMENPSAAARATGAATVAARQSMATQGTGVSHGVSPNAFSTRPGDLSYTQQGVHGTSTPPPDGTSAQPRPSGQPNNPVDPNAMRQQARDYVRHVASPEAPGAENRFEQLPSQAQNEVGRQIPGGDLRSLLFHLREIRQGYVDRPEGQTTAAAALNRFFAVRHGVSRADPHLDPEYEAISGRRTRVPRAPGEFTVQDQLHAASNVIGGGIAGGVPPTNTPRTNEFWQDFRGNEPGWRTGLRHQEIDPEYRRGLDIPRFGEFTIQDKLERVAQIMGNSAITAQRRAEQRDEDPTRVGGVRGLGANVVGYAAEQSAYLTMLNQHFQQMRRAGRGYQVENEALGLSREGTGALSGEVDLGPIGFRSPLAGTAGAVLESIIPGDNGLGSPAAREAVRQQLTRRQLQASAGISGEEAQAIQEQVRSLGYSENMNERLAEEVFAPAMRQGMDPGSVAQLADPLVRQGNNNLQEVADLVRGLGEAAAGARMSIQDATEATVEYRDAMAQMGSSQLQATRNAATFMQSGIDPRVISNAMQNPMVQGAAIGQTGLPAELLGTLGATEQSDAVSRSLNMALSMGSSLRNRDTFRNINGKRIQVGEGEDAQRAFAAARTGLPIEFIERFQRNPNLMQDATNAEAMLQAFETRVTETPGGTRRGDALEGPGEGDAVGWADVERTLRQIDPGDRTFGAQVDRLEREDIPYDQRIRKARDMIRRHAQPREEAEDQQRLDLTDDARKLLRLIPHGNRRQREADAGGQNVNQSVLGPDYVTPWGGR